MKVIKFCACGVKLERSVSDEENARRVVELFWMEHAGVNHKPITKKNYEELIRKIIRRAARRGLPVSEMEAYEKAEVDQALDWLEKANGG